MQNQISTCGLISHSHCLGIQGGVLYPGRTYTLTKCWGSRVNPPDESRDGREGGSSTGRKRDLRINSHCETTNLVLCCDLHGTDMFYPEVRTQEKLDHTCLSSVLPIWPKTDGRPSCTHIVLFGLRLGRSCDGNLYELKKKYHREYQMTAL